jgi:hypothetical protein
MSLALLPLLAYCTNHDIKGKDVSQIYMAVNFEVPYAFHIYETAYRKAPRGLA